MHVSSDGNPLPSARQIRADMSDDTRQRTVLGAVVAIVPTLAVYLLGMAGMLLAPLWLWPLLIPVVGLAVGVLIVLAHDAAHDSITPYPWLNGVIGRVLFIPAWHNCTGWIHAHNHVHHGWTNFQPRDYIWAPMSVEQYRSLSPWGRWWYRLGRWWPAFGLYYAWDILWLKITRLQPEIRQPRMRTRWRLDNVFLLVGIAAQTALILWLARRFEVATHPVLLVIGMQVVPFAIGAWLLGFLTYLHHTHPSIPWFQDQQQWSFYMGQICGTTHVQFPGRINRIIHNIMEHNAHHVDPKIPLYHLPAAQDQIERRYQPVITDFGVRSFFYTQRVCQLYDYREHCWLDYAGRQTSARTVSEDLLRRAEMTHARHTTGAA